MSYEPSDFAKTAAERAGEAAVKAKQFAADATDQARQRAETALHAGQERIRENPFSSVLATLLVGMALGLLLSQVCLWAGKSKS
ncbi:MAG TPA: hypothetical protein VIT21_03375 [Chthoniobacterales bacterium]